MHTVRIVLATESKELAENVSYVVQRINGCQLEIISLSQAVVEHTSSEVDPALRHASLVLLHQSDLSDQNSISSILKSIKSLSGQCLVICEQEHARCLVQWLKRGAVDSLVRPLNLARLSFLIDSLTLKQRYHGKDESNWVTLEGVSPFCVASSEMQLLHDHLHRVANQGANVLISGESGTGKTHMAKMVHALSARSSEPFLAVNCAALPESLIESELFGHVSGSFTGATTNRDGVFSQVGTGTLFMDEIDSIPLSSQAKLLHAVDDHGFTAVGDNHSQQFKGRILAATNQDLEELVKKGQFRRDLFYRLRVLQLKIPPLRERPSEIVLLAEEYLKSSAIRDGCACKRLSSDAQKLLLKYHWPGNVRELYNAMEHALAFSDSGEIQVHDIPVLLEDIPSPISSSPISSSPISSSPISSSPIAPSVETPEPHTSLKRARELGEIKELETTLKVNNYNCTKTAKQLGISRSALYKRLHKLGLHVG